MILLEDVAALLGLVFALVGVGMSLITDNHYWDVAGTAAIGLLLVTVAVILAVETKSLLLGEAASPESQRAIEAALTGTPGVDRVIHMKTLHLGPDELLVAAKIGVTATSSAAEVAATIDAAERAVRAAEPLATAMYLEPDIYREDHVPAGRPERHRTRAGTERPCGVVEDSRSRRPPSYSFPVRVGDPVSAQMRGADLAPPFRGDN